MGLSDELRAGVESIWKTVVTHPFVAETAGRSLERERFYVYFDQDYPFLREWAILLSLVTAKSPDFDAVRELGGEEGLFQEPFRKRGICHKAVAGLQYLRTLTYKGTFTEVVDTLPAVEWPYLDWAQRAGEADRKPSDRCYQTWIDIHPSPGMSRFVSWLRSVADESAPTAAQQDQLLGIFRDVIRYEYQCFEMAYRGES